MTLNNHPLAIKILTKVFTAYTKVLRKYMFFYDTYGRAFQDFWHWMHYQMHICHIR